MQQQSKLARRENALSLQEVLSGCFPDGVVEHILVRVPVKSLIRFKAVSKSWKEFLSSPCFIQMQLDHAKKRQKSLCYAMNAETHIPKISYVSETCDLLASDPIFTPFKFGRSDWGTLEASCNGLLSFRFSSCPSSIYLWNPATRKSKHVKLPHVEFDPSVGIGFAAKSNTYKMVRVSNNIRLGWSFISDSGWNTLSLSVYNMSLDSWKELKLDSCYGPLNPGQAVILEGCMHWYTEDGGGLVAAFDVENEVLAYFPLPHIEELLSVFNRQLAIIRESLSVLVCFRSKSHALEYGIWQMNEYGIETSWRKVASIDSFSKMIAVPFGFDSDGKILFKIVLHNCEEVFSYESFIGVETRFDLPPCLKVRIVNHTETLVSLDCWKRSSPQERQARKSAEILGKKEVKKKKKGPAEA